jgi:hypothetical protein
MRSSHRSPGVDANIPANHFSPLLVPPVRLIQTDIHTKKEIQNVHCDCAD